MCKLLLLLALLGSTQAQLSLYIPDTDPQPLSAIELGVGENGRTTWEILPGEPTGTWVRQADGFPTLTLVEGAQDAILTGAPDLSFAVSCTLLPTTPGQSTPLASCTNLDGGAGWEEDAAPILVQTGADPTGDTTATSGGTSAQSTTRAISPNGPVSGSPVVPSSSSRPQGSGALPSLPGLGAIWIKVGMVAIGLAVFGIW
ncbi:hypothetical protein DACRYDRAFT_90507 [Dacryopinax primogenitus]|uniref:Uncharacterized protein n=1 Tax=Dacryopinax primogenitus (strain DJM 731) TaxID=1858805 RepID=M5G6Q5_DACPD|nr:uncharacterized protein DACRYDRAFT_90507 [Dacryopinax primogenitus]EJT99442.1 hypothetical protein DACRYDRAFT_90507 [Dacryopinax primogenitus]